jgi:hypothetical protein
VKVIIIISDFFCVFLSLVWLVTLSFDTFKQPGKGALFELRHALHMPP